MTANPSASERFIRSCAPGAYGVREDEYPIDFTRSMGTECCISHVSKGGKWLRVYGWSARRHRLVSGTHVLLAHQSGESSRYVLKNVKHPYDPDDMWFADAKFKPRKASLRKRAKVLLDRLRGIKP